MINFLVVVAGVAEVFKWLTDKFREKTAAVAKTLQQENTILDAAERVLKIYQKHAPRSASGGPHAADKIRFYIEKGRDSDTIVIDLSGGAEKLMFTITGTAPHMIKGNPLAFMSEGDNLLFRQFVMHPGTAKSDWAEIAKRESEKEIQYVIRKHGDVRIQSG